MKSPLIHLARACLKLTIFLILTVLLVKPLVTEIVSWGRGNIVDVVLTSAPQFLGMLCKILLICAGMILNCAVTRRIRRAGILPFMVGAILTVLICGAAQIITGYLVPLLAMIITSMLTLLLVSLISTIVFAVLSYKFLIIILLFSRDEWN